jgi:ABC-type sugar transport system ATPase subunit
LKTVDRLMTIENDQDTILEAKAIVKDFPGQRALDCVDFDVRQSEVHALIGENGAGKSTLIKIIAGVYHPDQGEILVAGQRQHIASPRDAQSLGMAFIHQELNIVPHLSVAENIFLGHYPRNGMGLVSFSKMVEMTQSIPDALSIGVDLRTPAGALSVIQQWKVVINRALAQNSHLIFMDEPTSSLTHDEVHELFQSIAHLKGMGKSIVYVSHRMEEVFRIADRVTVIKDAKNVGTARVGDLDSGKIYQMMLGRDLEDVFPKRGEPEERVCLEVKGLTRAPAVENVSFLLHRGEILGIAGLVGSGRTELARLIFGADKKDGGAIRIGGEEVTLKSPEDAIRHRIALVPEERRNEGLVLPMDVKQNVTLASLAKLLRWLKIPVMSARKERLLAQPLVQSTAVKTSGLSQTVELLSGGNQQKVVLAKWLCSEAAILIFDEPTKGIDVGAKFAIYELITDLARNGVGVILISSDLIEVVGLSHRILVMAQGEIKADLSSEETDLSAVLALCLGENGSSGKAELNVNV